MASLGSSAQAILEAIHGTLLCGLARRIGLHFQGLRQAGRVLRSRGLVLSKTSRKLKDLDTAYTIARHITAARAGEFVDSVFAEVPGAGSATESLAPGGAVPRQEVRAETGPSAALAMPAGTARGVANGGIVVDVARTQFFDISGKAREQGPPSKGAGGAAASGGEPEADEGQGSAVLCGGGGAPLERKRPTSERRARKRRGPSKAKCDKCFGGPFCFCKARDAQRQRNAAAAEAALRKLSRSPLKVAGRETCEQMLAWHARRVWGSCVELTASTRLLERAGS